MDGLQFGAGWMGYFWRGKTVWSRVDGLLLEVGPLHGVTGVSLQGYLCLRYVEGGRERGSLLEVGLLHSVQRRDAPADYRGTSRIRNSPPSPRATSGP